MVEFLQVFLDPLHLLVRVGDLLLEKLIEEVLDTMVGRCATCLKRTTCCHCACDCHTATIKNLVDLASQVHCHLFFWVKDTDSHEDPAVKVKTLKWSTPYGREIFNLLKDLDLAALLPSRATKIKTVWSGFLNLLAVVDGEILLSNEEISIFKKAAITWVNALTAPSTGDHASATFQRGMYPGCVTPYIHALVYHVPEMFKRCREMGIPLRWLSAEPVEGKNHLHVHRFFASTHRDGGWPGESAEMELMAIERRLFYNKFVLKLSDEGRKVHEMKYVQ